MAVRISLISCFLVAKCTVGAIFPEVWRPQRGILDPFLKWIDTKLTLILTNAAADPGFHGGGGGANLLLLDQILLKTV